jgi:hypothetical protein
VLVTVAVEPKMLGDKSTAPVSEPTLVTGNVTACVCEVEVTEFVVEVVSVLGVPIVTEPEPVIAVKLIPFPAATEVTVPFPVPAPIAVLKLAALDIEVAIEGVLVPLVMVIAIPLICVPDDTEVTVPEPVGATHCPSPRKKVVEFGVPLATICVCVVLGYNSSKIEPFHFFAM